MGSSSVPVYRSGLTDSSRWQRLELRPGDIIISAPSKCGNTWLQMICALLILQTPRLPASLTTLSPWVDMRLRPLNDLRDGIAGQRHRRFLKTHTPLDGLPAIPDVTYLVKVGSCAGSMTHGPPPRTWTRCAASSRTSIKPGGVATILPSC